MTGGQTETIRQINDLMDRYPSIVNDDNMSQRRQLHNQIRDLYKQIDSRRNPECLSLMNRWMAFTIKYHNDQHKRMLQIEPLIRISDLPPYKG